MNHLSKTMIRLMAVMQIFAITLLASCATVASASVDTTETTACHATGDPANPYEEITTTNDISPVPANGCPASAAVITDGKVTICHATGNEANPYEEITVSANGLNGHGTHAGDIITSPEDGCPQSAGSLNSGRTAICHLTGDAANPYEEITFKTSSELKDYRAQNPDDISPVPANGCPATLALISNGNIMICHAVSGEDTPYNEIAVSVNGLDGHGVHEGDIIPMPVDGCPASLVNPATSNDKITICHATGSDKNPYNEITISVSGLNGHTGHEGDIIPAPAGGCPTTKP